MRYKSILKYDPTCKRFRIGTFTYAENRKQISIGLEPYFYKDEYSMHGNRSKTFFGFRINFKRSGGGRFI